LGLCPAIFAVFILQALFTLGVIYYPVVKRFREKEEILLTSLLVISLIVVETVNYVYPINAGVDLPTTILEGNFKIGPVSMPNQMIFVMAAAVISTAFFIIFLLKTRLGYKIRAISQDRKAAALLGVRVERVYALAMVLAVIPPTICMLLIAPIWAIEPLMGNSLLETAILVTILGGLGNLRGTVIASFIVGLIASGISYFGNPRLVEMATLVIVFFMLIFKPQGIVKSETLW
jgi:branched-chain amino acid transport system permease protein